MRGERGEKIRRRDSLKIAKTCLDERFCIRFPQVCQYLVSVTYISLGESFERLLTADHRRFLSRLHADMAKESAGQLAKERLDNIKPGASTRMAGTHDNREGC